MARTQILSLNYIVKPFRERIRIASKLKQIKSQQYLPFFADESAEEKLLPSFYKVLYKCVTMCDYVYLCVHVLVPWRSEESVRSPRAIGDYELMDDCEPPKKTSLLCKSSKCSQLLSYCSS